MEIKTGDLVELVDRTVNMIRFKAEEKQQKLIHKSLPEPVWIKMDEDLVARAVGNIVSNAVKFSPVGGCIEVGIHTDGDSAVISVKDNGIGIPPEMHEGIYAMFTDRKRVGTSGEQAFGLGLYITKQIVERHNGRLWYESEGVGTTFYLSFPRMVDFV